MASQFVTVRLPPSHAEMLSFAVRLYAKLNHLKPAAARSQFIRKAICNEAARMLNYLPPKPERIS